MRTKILLFLTIFSLLSCSSDDSTPKDPFAQLPPETQTGANTFGCIIDGKILLPRSGNTSQVNPLSGAILYGGYPDVYDYFELKILDYKTPKSSSFLFHLHNIVANGIGTYQIDKSNGMRNIDGMNNNYIHCNVFNDETNSYEQFLSYDNSGTYTITRISVTPDYTIISGTFNCNLKNINDSNDEISITNGRFDINSLTIFLKYFP